MRSPFTSRREANIRRLSSLFWADRDSCFTGIFFTRQSQEPENVWQLSEMTRPSRRWSGIPMNTTGIPVWQNGSGSSADSYTEKVENQIRKADGKLKKGQRNNSGTNLSLKMTVLWRNCKCRKETFYVTQWNLQGVPWKTSLYWWSKMHVLWKAFDRSGWRILLWLYQAEASFCWWQKSLGA